MPVFYPNKTLPPITATDNNKVLTAKDGKAEWAEPTGSGSVVAVEASQLGDLDLSKYPAGTLIVGYEDLDEEDIKEVAEQ